MTTSSPPARVTPGNIPVFEMAERQEDIDDFFYDRGWGDGLPLVAPTRERVDEMLGRIDLDPATILGSVPVAQRQADLRSVAVNAVMAGCRPEQMPAVVGLLEAVLEPSFNLAGVQATTHLCAPLAVIGGPVVGRLGLNCGAGLFGPGTRANAVIGRALRLILINIGGGSIGTGDKATFGQPGKFTYVGAENQAENPWTSLREDAGFDASVSAVTVFAAEGPHNVNDHGSTLAEGVLRTIAGTLSTLGNNNLYLSGQPLVILGIEHAAMCAREHLSKQDVREAIFEYSKLPAGSVWWENRARFARIRPDPFADVAEEDLVSVVPTPEDIAVTVTGGPGRHSLVIPTFGASKTTTVHIREERP